ncbi:MAG TPA: tetratricopeptide repeat protein [Oleiagrimonas sp.]|nr:tetratricopeptide repeat protein [Oleiagrimonas sp.]
MQDAAGDDWNQRIARLWTTFDDHEPAAFRAAVQALADERPEDDAVALFELASSNDSTGREAHAAPLYRRALENGLTGIRRRRATIQLASTLRNLGQADEAVALLRAERTRTSDELDDAVVAFLALALVDTGHEREAAALALEAMSRHLPRYNRSLARYAADIATR